MAIGRMEALPTCADVQLILHAVVAADASDRLEDAPDAPSRRHLQHADELRSVGQARRHADGGDIRHVHLGAQSVGLRECLRWLVPRLPQVDKSSWVARL